MALGCGVRWFSYSLIFISANLFLLKFRGLVCGPLCVMALVGFQKTFISSTLDHFFCLVNFRGSGCGLGLRERSLLSYIFVP